MTTKTKKTLITVGVVFAAILVIKKARENRMIADENSGIFGLGLFGIL